MSVLASANPTGTPRPLDRRVERLTVAQCPCCESTDTGVATRTEFYVYLRCRDCSFVWSAPKPGHEPAGS
jgi:hypothetical protein